MPFVKGASRVLSQPEVFSVRDGRGRQALIEVPAGTRVRLHATALPDLGPALPIPA
jgi:hypothetical protein